MSVPKNANHVGGKPEWGKRTREGRGVKNVMIVSRKRARGRKLVRDG